MFGSLGVGLLLAQMKVNQWKSQEELEAIQERKLKALFSHAVQHVPYYRKLAGITLRSMDDLPKLPLTRKEDVQNQGASFISSLHRPESLSKTTTSGSSGKPLTIFHDAGESCYGPAFELHQMTEAGVGPFDVQASISDSPSRQRLIQALGIFRRYHVPVQAEESQMLLQLSRIKPKALQGYPSVLVPLAHENAGLRIDKIFSATEVLSPSARKLISSSFGADMYDMYGAVETSWIAWQCDKGSMHISDSIVAEIVDDEGNPVKKGEYGNIVLTPLWKRSMPLIRYYLGDRAAFGPKCSCGRGLHVLKPIEGRIDDCIILPSGRVRSPRSINLFDDLQELRQYQIVQERPDLIVFRYVPRNELSVSTANEIVRILKDGCLNEDVRIEFEQVSSITRGRTGKIRTVVSKVRAR